MVQHSGRSEFNMSHSDENGRISIQGKGEITFTDDDADVASLSDDGYLMIDVRNAEGRRRVEIEFRRGTIERRFYVEGHERPWDQDARSWLAKTIPDIIRQTGIGAKARVKRLVARQGANGVLDEVAKITSSYVKRTYLTALMDATTLDSAAWQRLFRDAGRQMSSDYELTQVVLAAMSRQPDAAARLAAVDALSSVRSDYEHRRALAAIVKAGPLTPAIVRAMLQSAHNISSDYEQRQFLQQLIAAGAAESATAADLFGAIRTISSDFERRQILSALVGRAVSSPDIARELFQSVLTMRSDSERGDVLRNVGATIVFNDATRQVFFKVVDAMHSDFERKRVLLSVLRGKDSSDAVLKEVLASAAGMTSDAERANVLLDLVNRHGVSETLKPSFQSTVDRMRSDFEHRRIMSAMQRGKR